MKLWRDKHWQAHYAAMDDMPLIQAVLRQETGAWEAFEQRLKPLLSTLCATVFRESERAAEYRNLLGHLQAQDFAVLRVFDGRATLSTYLTLRLSDLLADRIRALFDEDANRAWQAFERFFYKDLRQMVARYFPASRVTQGDGSTPMDRYQEICALLIEQDYRRIKGYDGRGSFAGYLRRIVRNLCIDLSRRDEGRRQLPEAVKPLPALEQEVYKALYWDRYAEDAVLHTMVARGHARAQVEQAVARVRQIAGENETSALRPVMVPLPGADTMTAGARAELPDARPDPEHALIEGEEQAAQEKLLATLQAGVAQLPTDMQLYIRLRFFTMPQKSPREIARLMQRPEADIYKIRQQAVAALKTCLKARGLWGVAGPGRLQLAGEA